jgi:hypothetical protein
MNIPGHFSESLETIFWVKILNLFNADPEPGSGIIVTLDQNSDPGSGKIIPDPQHEPDPDFL